MKSPPPDENPVPTRRRRGRPRKLDEAARREVCAIISSGCGMAAAARYVGCAPNTIRNEAQLNPDFALALRRAFMSSELGAVNAIRSACERSWRAAAWFLERTDPHRYGRFRLKALKPEVIQQCLDLMIDVVTQEVEDPEVLRRITASLKKVGLQQQRDAWLAERDLFMNACGIEQTTMDDETEQHEAINP